MPFIGSKRRWLLLVSAVVAFAIFARALFINQDGVRRTIDKVKLPGLHESHMSLDGVRKIIDTIKLLGSRKNYESLHAARLSEFYVPHDKHPISLLMVEADKKWQEYDNQRSRTFKECLSKYRQKYGRHPPPHFDVWYKFARERGVHNVDDFEQIMDDLRPFWAIQPRIMRTLAAHMWEKEDDGISAIHIRNHEVAGMNFGDWRAETLIDLINRFVEYLPDMDIALNRLDQPRVVVPWDNMQAFLATELETRQLRPETTNEFSADMANFFDLKRGKDDGGPREDAGWYMAAGKQYMNIASNACPPESHAVLNKDTTSAEAVWKERAGGIVKNFNLSTDLCTVGPEIGEKHGFLYSASSIVATDRLVPVFGECKINVNNDILFPANMYWKKDKRYIYDDSFDVKWADKREEVVWRGVTSGGVQLRENWQRMHRQRLVHMLNASMMAEEEVRILTEQAEAQGEFENFRQFKPSALIEEHADVGFTETMSCIPNCDFYNDVWTMLDQIPLPAQFLYKFLIDVDGHSFSGRWRAFLQSQSLGIKATIFREWHDSRLFAWRHFVPLDNRYDELFTLLTYFLGIGDADKRSPGEPFVPRHDDEAKRLALQGRDWAEKVLRNEDIEIYMFRLLLEYGRLIDDNRDRIGYAGDGAELQNFDERIWSKEMSKR